VRRSSSLFINVYKYIIRKSGTQIVQTTHENVDHLQKEEEGHFGEGVMGVDGRGVMVKRWTEGSERWMK
jgi:hypothetical protein